MPRSPGDRQSRLPAGDAAGRGASARRGPPSTWAGTPGSLGGWFVRTLEPPARPGRKRRRRRRSGRASRPRSPTRRRSSSRRRTRCARSCAATRASTSPACIPEPVRPRHPIQPGHRPPRDRGARTAAPVAGLARAPGRRTCGRCVIGGRRFGSGRAELSSTTTYRFQARCPEFAAGVRTAATASASVSRWRAAPRRVGGRPAADAVRGSPWIESLRAAGGLSVQTLGGGTALLQASGSRSAGSLVGITIRMDQSEGGLCNPTDNGRSRTNAYARGYARKAFRTVYRFRNEQLLEVINLIAHAAALSALVETETAYRLYFAVYVRSVGRLTPFYMALIDPLTG